MNKEDLEMSQPQKDEVDSVSLGSEKKEEDG